jgi:hypothetical protein
MMVGMTTLNPAPSSPAPYTGAWTRYRNAYSKLPPSVQMIGLQIWLPTLFVLLFCFCYIFAFHSPTPKDVPVAVVGSSQTASPFAASLQKGSDGALTVKTLATAAEARTQVRSGELAAAYIPGAKSSQLVIASGAQFQLATLAKEVFTPVAAEQKVTMTVVDLAPLPKGDSFGTALFYMTLVATIGGYMVAMFVGLMGGPLRHRTRIGIIAAFAVLFPLVSTLLLRFPLGVISGHFFAVWAIGSATALAIGLVVNGLSYFLGRFVTGAALFLFVFLNVPSSGGAFPAELVPEPFKSLHPFVSGTGTLDLYRHVIYGVGPGAWAGLLVLACYAAGGLILTLTGRPYARRLAARRAARGARPSMMQAAQHAAMALAAASVAAPKSPEAAAVPEEREGREPLELGSTTAVADPDSSVVTADRDEQNGLHRHRGQHAAEPYTVTIRAAEPISVQVTVSEPVLPSAGSPRTGAHADDRSPSAEGDGSRARTPVDEHALDEAEREMADFRAAEVESDAVAAVTGAEA